MNDEEMMKTDRGTAVKVPWESMDSDQMTDELSEFWQTVVSGTTMGGQWQTG